MVQLIHEVAHLVLERSDLAVALRELLLLALQVKRFLVDHPVKLLDLVEGLRDLKLQVTNVGAQVVAFVGLHLVGHVQTINFLEILPVTVSESSQFIINLPLL